MAHDIFISYSTGDKPSADAICAALESRGIRCWIAPRDVLPGEEYAAAIVSALHKSRVMVLVFSSGANQSQQVLREVERGVSGGLPIIPLRIENVPPSAAMEYYISSRHWLDALTPPLEQHLVHLADTVKLLLSRTPDSPVPPAPSQAVKPVPSISAEFPVEKDRKLRCQSAAEIRSDLKRLKRDTSSGKVKTTSQTDATASSGPAATVIAVTTGRTKRVMAGVAIVALGLATFSVYKWLTRPRGFNLENMRITKLTDSGKVDRVAISPDGRNIVYVLRDGEQQSLWVRNVATKSDVQVLPPDAVEFAGVTFSPDGNYVYFVRSDKSTTTFRYLYVMPVLGGIPRQLIRDVDAAVSFSPNGSEFVFMRGVQERRVTEIHIANADGSGDHLLASLPAIPGSMMGLAWSPDGKTIVVPVFLVGKEIKDTLEAINIADGSVRELFSSLGEIGKPVWLPDGNALLIGMNAPPEWYGQLWFVSYPSGEKRRFTNDLSNYDNSTLDLTRDGQMLVTLENRRSSHIWIVPQGQTARAKQITSGESPDIDAVPGPGGKLLVRSRGSDLVLMNADGTQRTLLRPNLQSTITNSSCGDHYLVFKDWKGNGFRLLRTDADGSNPTTLSEDALVPDCSPDGRWVVYGSLENKLYRLPIEGGTPTEVASAPGVGGGVISPDGKWIAYGYEEGSPVPVLKIAVIPAAGGSPVHVFVPPVGIQLGRSPVRWSPDQKGLQFLLTKNGATNVWEQLLAGGAPHQLTNFTSGLIFNFSWTRDGKQLLLAKGDLKSDVVLISNFR
jgi:Tol biopolymer transport system component